MKTYALIPVLLALSLASRAEDAAVEAPTDQTVTVQFVQPEKYTDASDRGFGSRITESVKRELTAFFQKEGDKYLQEGQTLSVEILDVDLAGHYEPGRAPGYDDVRILRDSTWPRMHFKYTLKQGDEVLQSDEVELSDMNYLMGSHLPYAGEPLAYDKRMLDRWFYKTLGPGAARGAATPKI